MKLNKLTKIILPVLLTMLTTGSILSQAVKAEVNIPIESTSTEIKEKNVDNSRTFTFLQDEEGWSGGFADLPVNYEKDIYELDFKQTSIPIKGTLDKGLMLKGHNRSDDLFMYISRKFGKEDGLSPNTKYTMLLSFKLATNAAGSGMGIGGAPGESVFVKAGITNKEPVVEDINGEKTINIDKGSQSTGGKDMQVIGNVAKVESDDNTYEYKTFENKFEVVTNDKGEAWVIIGTDSGYEGLTQIYMTDIKLTTNDSNTGDDSNNPIDPWKIGWNKNSTGWWYCTDTTNKYYYKDTWKKIDGEWYSFDSEGYAKASKWFEDGDKWYWLKDSCKMAESEWIWIDGKWYCFNASGALYINCTTLDGYTVDENGAWVQ